MRRDASRVRPDGQITLKNLRHSYGAKPRDPDDWALKQLDIEWSDGGAYALLGPSGCGKTTLLNIISGLVRPTEGRVLFDDVDLTDVPTDKRHIAQVFQFPVVYDTMTVYDNLAFPLRNRGLPEPEVDAQGARDRPHARPARTRSRGAPPASRRTASRRSRSAAAWSAPTSTSSCSTSR